MTNPYNPYIYPPRRTPVVRFNPKIQYINDQSLNSLPPASKFADNVSSSSSLSLTPCRLESSATLRKYLMEQYLNLNQSSSSNSSFESLPETSLQSSLSTSTSSLEDDLDSYQLVHREWPFSPIRPDHSTHVSWVTTGYGPYSACHPASVSGYGRGLFAEMDGSLAGPSFVTSSFTCATGYQVPGPTEMNGTCNSYNDLDFDETTNSERLENLQNRNSKAVNVATPFARPPSFRTPATPPRAIEDNSYENLPFDETTETERISNAHKVVPVTTPAQNADFLALAAPPRVSDYNSYDDLPFDDTTYTERVTNSKNAAVAIPAPPPVFRAPLPQTPRTVTRISIRMSSNNSINSHRGLDAMLRKIQTGKSKIPIDQNSTVNTEAFGNDKEFWNLVSDGSNVSRSRRTSKRKARIPKVKSPIPMKKSVLRSSTPISSPKRSKSDGGLLERRSPNEKRRRESTDAQFSPDSPKTHRRSGKARKSKRRANRSGKYAIEKSMVDIYRRYPSTSSQDSGVCAPRIGSGTDDDDKMGLQLSRFARGIKMTSTAIEEPSVVFRKEKRPQNGHFATEVRQPAAIDNRRYQSLPRKTTGEARRGYEETPRRTKEPTGAEVRMHINRIVPEQPEHEIFRPARQYYPIDERNLIFKDEFPTSYLPKSSNGEVLSTPRNRSNAMSSMRTPMGLAEKPRILSSPGEVFSTFGADMPPLDITDIPPPLGPLYSPLHSPVTPEYVNLSTYRYLALNEDGGTRRRMTLEERIAVDAGHKLKAVVPAVLDRSTPSLEEAIFNGDSTEIQAAAIRKELVKLLQDRIEHFKTGKENAYTNFELAMMTPYHHNRILTIRKEAPGANMKIVKVLVCQAVEDRLKLTDCPLIHLAYEVLFEVWDDVFGFQIQYLLNQQASPEFKEFEAEFFNL